MSKTLTQPFIVQAELRADRLDINGYTVDAQAMTVAVDVTASQTIETA